MCFIFVFTIYSHAVVICTNTWLCDPVKLSLCVHTFKSFFFFTVIQCCGSGMFIPDRDFPSRIPNLGSRIPDPTTPNKKRRGKNQLSFLYYSHKFIKIAIFFIFEQVQKKNLAYWQKNLTYNPKIWAGDLRSRRNLSRPRFMGQKGIGSRTSDPHYGFYPGIRV